MPTGQNNEWLTLLSQLINFFVAGQLVPRRLWVPPHMSSKRETLNQYQVKGDCSAGLPGVTSLLPVSFILYVLHIMLHVHFKMICSFPVTYLCLLLHVETG